jgi:nucleoside-diphosphate-sugar epimerase
MKQQIGILGCGWVGLPLAKELIKRGFEVKGSTTNPAKVATMKTAGISPFVLKLNPSLEGEGAAELLSAEILFVNIPPKITLNGLDFHVKQIEALIAAIPSTVRRVFFVSSTSVYPDLNREVAEEDASPAAHPVLMQAEGMMQAAFGDKLTILRLAGLMGYDRYPAKYFAGKKGLTSGDLPVNYIHRDDLVHICAEVICRTDIVGIFNVVAPEHPKRRDVYAKNCQDLGLEQPEFVNAGEQDFKVVNGNKLIQLLGYQFVYPNPIDFRYNIGT